MKSRPPGRRLLFLTYSHARIGGIETWIDQLAAGLLVHDWDVCVASAWGAKHNDPTWRETASPLYITRRLDGRTGTRIGRERAIARAVLELQPDVVLPVGLADALAGISDARAAGWKGHAVAALHAGSAAQFADLALHARALSAVGCVNATHARVLRKRLPIDGPEVVACPNGVAISRAETPWSRREIDTALRILFVGRLEQLTKRILDLPRIASRLQQQGTDFRASVVGEGPDRHALEAAIADLGVASRVSLLGARQHEALDDLYRTHDVTLLCSNTEAAPLVLMEGMAHGAIAVTSEFPGFRGTGYLSAEAGAHTFPVGDVGAAAKLLDQLARNEALRDASARAAVRHLSQLSEESCVARWCGLLRSVLERPVPTPTPGDGRAKKPGAGRLDALLPAAAAEHVRWWLRRFPERSDGWEEWPGSSSEVTPEAAQALREELETWDVWGTPDAFQEQCACEV